MEAVDGLVVDGLHRMILYCVFASNKSANLHIFTVFRKKLH